ncbi:MAG: cyclic nucleotide-binding domain-containing protein [Propionivibrio sp.]|uniref:Cyclic nucleotide-binding domain-containing protein n=1 Tax=Candidatus Propionivibrio dominans TaxID=2954373 RepID=A0A9D7FD65_9RHOO|nr:cyclic nucleotide-binding domain-containing protein [Candidatus Propionivibrio dominans]MBL0167511.1 cyclic nucleotide-binding domain-containing protein [Propionivibrio sp.]
MRKVLYILGQLTDQDTDWLAVVGKRVHVKSGELLVRQGEHLDQLFIVLDGELKVLAAQGQEIARVGVGDILGEMSFVDDSPTSASVQTISEVLVLAVEHRLISQRMAADAAFAARFYKSIAIFLADRMRNVLARFGYGESPDDLDEMQHGELDGHVLDTLHLAGSRFDRMLKKLIG